ncbi:MAG: hypothetical protein AB7T49_17695 [Oligoflexales bacterium]
MKAFFVMALMFWSATASSQEAGRGCDIQYPSRYFSHTHEGFGKTDYEAVIDLQNNFSKCKRWPHHFEPLSTLDCEDAHKRYCVCVNNDHGVCVEGTGWSQDDHSDERVKEKILEQKWHPSYGEAECHCWQDPRMGKC